MQKKETKKIKKQSVNFEVDQQAKEMDNLDNFLDEAANVFPAAREVHKANKKYKINPNHAPTEGLSNK